MNRENIDRILSKRDDIIPSVGFSSAVMEAVRREAEAPPPIPFPWKRLIPGLVAVAAALGWLVAAIITLVVRGSQAIPSGATVELVQLLNTWKPFGVGWIALALLTSLASWKLSTWLASYK